MHVYSDVMIRPSYIYIYIYMYMFHADSCNHGRTQMSFSVIYFFNRTNSDNHKKCKILIFKSLCYRDPYQFCKADTLVH